ncbi:MAG: non-ribosomal peptide synthetase, partial [Chthoniobacterales bacterium]
IANTYGPTECTDICAFYRLKRNNLHHFPFVPLGHTIPNVQLAVVDDSLQSLPQGETGELVIGGAGLGLGYLNDEDRTAEKFIQNPLPGTLDGEKTYRTGDRVRLLPEGILEFLGRVDHQVKIRGFRVELPEIEAALSAHPSIREAAVVLSNTELLAFYVPIDHAEGRFEDFRAFLSAQLPEYMLPHHIIALDKFPLTPNGKVDRLQLAQISVRFSAQTVTPGSETEDAIRNLWIEILKEDNIGLDDNFFDLGGDSIHLARVHQRLSELFNRPLPITDLFTHPTVRTLARHLGGATRGTGNTAIQQRAAKQREALAVRRRITHE